MNLISSIHNPKVKHWRKYQKSNFRKLSDTFFVEGVLECKRGLQSRYQLHELLICRDILDQQVYNGLTKLIDQDCEVYELSQPVYEKLAYRGDTEGVIGIFRKDNIGLESLTGSGERHNLFLIIENVEKPGNLGAILRTADAVKARAVILTGSGTDQYNPNVIRSSLGTIFSVPVICSSNEEVVKWALDQEIPLFCAALPSFKNLYELDFGPAAGFVFGTEHEGLSDFWIHGDQPKFTIPMLGQADSLNLSVSVAVTSYEYLRRRT